MLKLSKTIIIFIIKYKINGKKGNKKIKIALQKF